MYSKSAYLEKVLGREAQERSNGETAMVYFIERMENPGLYLLDEPENSLSFENQIKLAEFIESSARFLMLNLLSQLTLQSLSE